MNRSSQSPRVTKQLSEGLTANLNAYALAAAAGAVGILALSQPADAEIVFTPTNAQIPFDKYVSIDLNHDGTPDFKFFFYSTAYHSFNGSVNVRPHGAGGVIGTPDGYAAALTKGANIGPGQVFKNRRMDLVASHGFEYGSSQYNRSVAGPWAGAQDLSLGVEFRSGGATYYGWVRLSVSSARRPLTATITGYAYETVAGQPIHAGQVSDDDANAPLERAPMVQPSLGMLALGSPGRDLGRREDFLLSMQ